MTLKIDNDTLNDYVKANKFLFVFFYASWCGQSIMSHSLIDDLEKEINDEIKFVKIDLDENFLWENEKNGKYVIKKSPTFILFSKGKEVTRIEQFNSKEILKNLIKGNINVK